ncbi:MAG: phage tail sheath C-terminal domain-containing protein [Butyricicoccus sp.]
MAFGGGNFLFQNKVLPGTYINFVSVANASASLADRGTAVLPLELDWGPENKLFTVESANVQSATSCRKLFGHSYIDEELLPVREVFRYANKVHFFRLNSNGKAASNTFGTARYPGTRGNSLRIVVESNKDGTEQTPKYDVSTYLDTDRVDTQIGISSAEELADNDFILWDDDATLQLTAGMPLSGGTNGSVSNTAWQSCLEQAEAYTFNAIGCMSTDETVCDLFEAFARRMRNEVGKKFQCVCFRHLADFEGVVSLKNGLENDPENPALIPWVTGVIAGTAVNASATNLAYDGEYEVDAAYTQSELEAGIQEGSFLLHAVDGKIAVLDDINTFVSYTDAKGEDFASNQTIRVLDQIANDTAVLFGKKYLGKVPNDAAGRNSLWSDIVKHHKELQRIRAIEDFTAENVTVSRGETKKSVYVEDYVMPINAMTKLYMVVYVQ